jgi:translation initiation factor IF-2
MAEVTIKQLAEDVGTPVERLLKQLEDAGVRKRTDKDSVSDEEKQQLLNFL